MKKKLLTVIISFILAGLLIAALLSSSTTAVSQDAGSLDQSIFSTGLPPVDSEQSIEVVNPYFSIVTTTLSNGTDIGVYRINGPSEPFPGIEVERQASILELPNRGIIGDFPSFSWVFGCSAVSGAMIAGYYDRNGYSDMYTGSANSGVMPMTDTSWSTWYDGVDWYPNNPLIASHDGVDGRSTRGSIDNYWVEYFSSANDPYITNGWEEHTWGTAIGDYMKTSQSAYGNVDGSTSFYFWYNNQKLTCDSMESQNIYHLDGTYGRKLFYEARGYTVGDCYSQNTDNQYPGGFSLEDFQAEIDAGHPVLLNLEGHSIVGYGYIDSTIYIRDTWDSDPENTYTMPWGGSYDPPYMDPMELLSVSVVHPELASPPSAPTGVSASDGDYADKVEVTWVPVPGATSYTVFRNALDTHLGQAELISGLELTTFNDTGTDPEEANYYWVQACNAGGCSDYSSPDTGFRSTPPTVYYAFLPLIVGGQVSVGDPLLNGDFEQGQVAWAEYSVQGWDIILNAPGYTHSGEWFAYLGGDNDEISYISQTITIESERPYLHYWYWIDSTDSCYWDYFNLYVDSTIVQTKDLCFSYDTGGWVEEVINLSGYSGNSCIIKFEVTTDSYVISNFFLDDVSFSGSASVSGEIFLQDWIDLGGITKMHMEW